MKSISICGHEGKAMQLPVNRTGSAAAVKGLEHGLALWGGMECSTVRVGDTWRDQLRETGYHEKFEAGLSWIAALGIRTLRTPILWERTIPHHPGSSGWTWHDRQINALRRLNITPIGELLHHGSGPGYTSLLDEHLPERLALHAARAAKRYPDIELWTPLNEPLTTGRFSCLYGHWYPHLRNEQAFLRSVSLQCAAIQAAMRAIRRHIPRAKFMHTEDLGRVFSTEPLAAQAAYENERRWLSMDLLFGRVDATHSWRGRLEDAGANQRHLDALQEGDAAPDLLGVNHYVTSDRFLDHRLSLYPSVAHGGNGRTAYVDTEATRVEMPPGLTGWKPRLMEAWRRFARPLVLSEVHLGCADPREQVRWLMEAWEAAQEARSEGADVRAVTAWALFGLVDWDCLLTHRRGHFEPGAISLQHISGGNRLLADGLECLAEKGAFFHPALSIPGWWKRDDRIHHALRNEVGRRV